MSNLVDGTQLRKRALDYLARREYARAELKQKLTSAFEGEPELEPKIDALLETLEEEGLLSEARYLEVLVKSLLSQGKGERALQAKLRMAGVSGALQAEALQRFRRDAQDSARSALRQKFGKDPLAPENRLKAHRFLFQRGFDKETAGAALRAFGVAQESMEDDF